MNTQPDATKILCFGDSNTWGYKPGRQGRYPANVRWTGQLQQLLGEKFYVIEEGLNSRTTDLEYAKKPGRNGKTYLRPCLETHNPIDIVVLMLGTNDLKIVFNRSPRDIALAIEGLILDIRQFAWNSQQTVPNIIVVSPILVDETAADFAKFYTDLYDAESAKKSKLLAAEIEHVVVAAKCHFINAAEAAKAGSDGIHFDETSHDAFAKLIGNEITTI